MTMSEGGPVLARASGLVHVARFCGQCNCGCPQLLIDHDAPAARRVVVTDDFGQRIQMSLAQLATMVAQVKGGVLDAVVGAAATSGV